MQKLYAAGLLKMNDSQGGTYMANNQVAAISQWGTELWEETWPLLFRKEQNIGLLPMEWMELRNDAIRG